MRYLNVNLKGEFMKKKILIFFTLAFCLLTLSACGKSDINLSNLIIEERQNLFVANDDLYSVSFSTGNRESDYNLDGVVNKMVPFGVICLSRNDNEPLANDTYTYVVKINDNSYTGFLQKGNDNSYCADLEVNTTGDETINVQISFTGYTFNQNLANVSKDFQVDAETAIKVAEKELKENINNLTSDKNIKLEVVMKIVKDYSSELKNYYWYVGIVATNGETLGILISTSTGEIIAKKV